MSSKGRCYRLTFSLALGFGGKRVLGSESQLRESVFLQSPPFTQSGEFIVLGGEGELEGLLYLVEWGDFDLIGRRMGLEWVAIKEMGWTCIPWQSPVGGS